MRGAPYRQNLFNGSGQDTDGADPAPHELLTDNTRLRRELGELRRQLERLAAAHDEMKATRARLYRRRDQLLGERAQLQARLAERDEMVQRLSRALGELSSSRVVDHGPGAFAQAARWLRARLPTGLSWRSRRESTKPQPGPLPSPTDTADESPLVPFADEHPAALTIAVAVFGLATDDLIKVLDTVAAVARPGVAPILLTDNDAFALFRARRLIFEYVPPPEQQRRIAPDLDWEAGVARRLALIRRKWRPERYVAYGHAARDVLQAWRESPFYDGPPDELFDAPASHLKADANGAVQRLVAVPCPPAS